VTILSTEVAMVPFLDLASRRVLGLFIAKELSVNTKNWYKEESDLWAKFGRRAPFDRRFSSKHSVEAPAVGRSLFSKRVVPRLKEESIREYVMTWIEYKEGTN
jgi:hypothetical protein